jgi:hypothetical protein
MKWFLNSFHYSSPTVIRDNAMALCMTEMGRHASEVTKLDLSNIG